MLPTFLGIGVPRSGTTWAHRLLAAHPDVVVPQHRKEVHYFDLHFDRGLEWYESFFPSDPSTAGALAVGEFTPHYLYDAGVPDRVRSVPTIDRFVVILRNPVDRAYSHYRFRRTQDNRAESFEEFVAREPTALAWGHYGQHLAPWIMAFGRAAILVLLLEDVAADAPQARAALARHLGVDADRFPAGAGDGAVNASLTPRRRRMYSGAVRQARWLRRHDLDRVITLARRSGVVAALKRPAPAAAATEGVSEETRRRLWPEFEDDVARLESLAGLDLAAWRPEAA